MNWEATAALAELLGAVGVIGSWLYLAGQVRGGTIQASHAAVRPVRPGNAFLRLGPPTLNGPGPSGLWRRDK